MNKNKFLSLMVGVGFVASFAAVIPALAQTSAPSRNNGMPNAVGMGMRGGMHGTMPPFVVGKVTAVNGMTFTVSQQAMMMRPTGTPSTVAPAPVIYTVDASNAKVYKAGATSTVASVATGDTVLVQGTVSGTNVIATMVRDGMGGMVPGGKRPNFPGASGFGMDTSSTIQGNGEPVVGGSVTAINGNTLTVTNASNVTYTIDISSAKIMKNGTTTTVASVTTGDNIIVQGAVNGNSVTATSVIDQGNGTHGTAAGGVTGQTTSAPRPAAMGFLGAIGSFFKHIFGF